MPQVAALKFMKIGFVDTILALTKIYQATEAQFFVMLTDAVTIDRST